MDLLDGRTILDIIMITKIQIPT